MLSFHLLPWFKKLTEATKSWSNSRNHIISVARPCVWTKSKNRFWKCLKSFKHSKILIYHLPLANSYLHALNVEEKATFQVWENIHTYGSSAYKGPSTLKHTARCSSKKSMCLSISRHRFSTRYRQTDQFWRGLNTPSASIQTDPNISKDCSQSWRTSSIKSIG